MQGRLDQLRRVVLAIEDGLLTTTLTVTLVLAIGQILLRNFWNTGISWADPSIRVLVLWITLLGAMAATRNRNHIKIDIIPRFLSPALRSLSYRISDLFATSVCAILAWHAARFVHFEYQDGNVLFASVPAWVCELILPLGFAVMAVRFLLSALTKPRSDTEQVR